MATRSSSPVPSAGRERLLPDELPARVRVFPVQNIRQPHLAQSVLQVPIVLSLHRAQMGLERFPEHAREERDPVAVPLRVPDHDRFFS